MTLSIMVIDDNGIDRMLALRTIRRVWPDARIVEYDDAHTALAALRAAPATRPDLILLDVRMPRMTGPEFLSATAADGAPGIAGAIIVLLTVGLPAQDQAILDSHPAYRGCIDKPVSEADLRRAGERLGLGSVA